MKFAVSACLLGDNCKYSGGNNYCKELIRYLEDHEVIKICPEVMGGLSVPRTKSELVNGIATTETGQCVHNEFLEGANKCLALLKNENIECVILQPRSPSCGIGKIYDGTFTGKLIDGNGIFVQLLKKYGFKTLTVDDFLESIKKPEII